MNYSNMRSIPPRACIFYIALTDPLKSEVEKKISIKTLIWIFVLDHSKIKYIS